MHAFIQSLSPPNVALLQAFDDLFARFDDAPASPDAGRRRLPLGDLIQGELATDWGHLVDTSEGERNWLEK